MYSFRPCIVFYNSKNTEFDSLNKVNTFKERVRKKLQLNGYDIPSPFCDIPTLSDEELEKYKINKSDILVFVIEDGGAKLQHFYDFESYLKALHITMKRA